MDRIYKNKKELIETLVPERAKVLDVGFAGQGVGARSPHYVHAHLYKRAGELWGIDLAYDEADILGAREHYARMSAEAFSLPAYFDVIFAGDLIEHLQNPGLFLDAAKKHLLPDGRLILTTPNAFNLFNLAEKLTKDEPTVNGDHTMYFNRKTLLRLLDKAGFEGDVAYLYTLDCMHRESVKKKALNVLYRILAQFSPKFVETLVVVARPKI